FAGAIDFIGAGIKQPNNTIANGFGQGKVEGRNHFAVVAVDRHQRRIDRVCAGAGHQSYIERHKTTALSSWSRYWPRWWCSPAAPSTAESARKTAAFRYRRWTALSATSAK